MQPAEGNAFLPWIFLLCFKLLNSSNSEQQQKNIAWPTTYYLLPSNLTTRPNTPLSLPGIRFHLKPVWPRAQPGRRRQWSTRPGTEWRKPTSLSKHFPTPARGKCCCWFCAAEKKKRSEDVADAGSSPWGDGEFYLVENPCAIAHHLIITIFLTCDGVNIVVLLVGWMLEVLLVEDRFALDGGRAGNPSKYKSTSCQRRCWVGTEQKIQTDI